MEKEKVWAPAILSLAGACTDTVPDFEPEDLAIRKTVPGTMADGSFGLVPDGKLRFNSQRYKSPAEVQCETHWWACCMATGITYANHLDEAVSEDRCRGAEGIYAIENRRHKMAKAHCPKVGEGGLSHLRGYERDVLPILRRYRRRCLAAL